MIFQYETIDIKDRFYTLKWINLILLGFQEVTR